MIDPSAEIHLFEYMLGLGRMLASWLWSLGGPTSDEAEVGADT